MAQPHWWDRLGAILRGKGTSSLAGELVRDESGIPIDRPREERRGAEAEPPTTSPHPLGRLLSRKPNARQLAQDRLVELVDGIQQHLVGQQQRTEQIAEALTQVAHTLSELPATARQQAETLAAIASQLEASTRHTQTLSESLKDMPRLQTLQAETLAGIKDQIGRANELDTQISGSLALVGQAVGTLNESSRAQVTTLSSLAAEAAQRETRLTEFVAKRVRRQNILFIVLIALAVAALAAACVAIAITLRGAG